MSPIPGVGKHNLAPLRRGFLLPAAMKQSQFGGDDAYGSHVLSSPSRVRSEKESAMVAMFEGPDRNRNMIIAVAVVVAIIAIIYFYMR